MHILARIYATKQSQTKSLATNIGTIPKNMPTNFQLKRLKLKLDIVKKPENRVHELTDSNVSQLDISGDIKPVAKANYVSSARAIVKEVHVQSSARLEITAQLVAARPGARVARYIESHMHARS